MYLDTIRPCQTHPKNKNALLKCCKCEQGDKTGLQHVNPALGVKYKRMFKRMHNMVVSTGVFQTGTVREQMHLRV